MVKYMASTNSSNRQNYTQTEADPSQQNTEVSSGAKANQKLQSKQPPIMRSCKRNLPKPDLLTTSEIRTVD
jgi:hypothetical protein